MRRVNPLGPLHPDTAALLGLPPETQVRAGTTDGVAAFLAAGAHAPGHGVTSLGSTLVLKLVSDRPVFSPAHGVYSHRLGDLWLTGGASNSGGAVLAQYFSADELRALTPLLKPDVPTGLDYYPLPGTGERFPVNDPALAPRLSPRPADRVVFLQGLLEGIARIEARGYELLTELGAPRLTALWTSRRRRAESGLGTDSCPGAQSGNAPRPLRTGRLRQRPARRERDRKKLPVTGPGWSGYFCFDASADLR